MRPPEPTGEVITTSGITTPERLREAMTAIIDGSVVATASTPHEAVVRAAFAPPFLVNDSGDYDDDEDETEPDDEVIPDVPEEPVAEEVAPAGIVTALESKKVRVSASVVGLADKITPLVSIAAGEQKRRVESMKRSAERNDRIASEKLREALQAKADAKSYKELAAKNRADAAAEEKKVVPVVNTQAVVDRLRRHKAVQYVIMGAAGSLYVHFKPTYTMAQTSESSKETVRMFVGCFQAKLMPGSSVDITVKNLTFPALEHWSVRGGRPCWGDWQSTVRDLWAKGDLYGLATMLAAYLASNAHAAAFSRTYNYHPARKHKIVVKNLSDDAKNYSRGDIALYNATDESTDTDGNSLLLLPIKLYEDTCRTGTGRSRSWAFLAPVNCNNHYRGGERSPEDRDWNVRAENTIPLTKEEQAEVLALIESVKGEPEAEQRQKLAEWGLAVKNQHAVTLKTADGVKEALLAYLDAAEVLDYRTVAQPLVIDASKLV